MTCRVDGESRAFHRVFNRLVSLANASNGLLAFAPVVAFAGTQQCNLAEVPAQYASVRKVSLRDQLITFWAVVQLAFHHVLVGCPSHSAAFSRAFKNVSEAFWLLFSSNELAVEEVDYQIKLTNLLGQLVKGARKAIFDDFNLCERVRLELILAGRLGWIERTALSILETAPSKANLREIDPMLAPVTTIFLNTDEVFAGINRGELYPEHLEGALFFAPRTYWTEPTGDGLILQKRNAVLFNKVLDLMRAAENEERLLIIGERNKTRINFWLALHGFPQLCEKLLTYDPRNGGYARFREMQTGLRPVLRTEPDWLKYCTGVELQADAAEAELRHARLQV
jgi:hypothetical protein